MERGPLLRARLGEDQRPGREVEGGEADLAGRLGAVFFPAQTAGDHEVEDEEEVPLQAEDDALKEGSITLAQLEPQVLTTEQAKVPAAAMERRMAPNAMQDDNAQPVLKRARAG